eukprot:1492726-Rhodomonas_salina.2
MRLPTFDFALFGEIKCKQPLFPHNAYRGCARLHLISQSSLRYLPMHTLCNDSTDKVYGATRPVRQVQY